MKGSDNVLVYSTHRRGWAMQVLKGHEQSLELEFTAEEMMLEQSSDDKNNRFVCSMDMCCRSGSVCSGGRDQ